MEDVREILTNHFGWQRKQSIDKTTKEITENVMLFTGWLRQGSNCAIFHAKTNMGLYKYWWENIRKKQ